MPLIQHAIERFQGKVVAQSKPQTNKRIDGKKLSSAYHDHPHALQGRQPHAVPAQ